MGLIRKSFESYMTALYAGVELDEDQIDALETAFMGGGAVILYILWAAIKDPELAPEDFHSLLGTFDKEVNDFNETLKFKTEEYHGPVQ